MKKLQILLSLLLLIQTFQHQLIAKNPQEITRIHNKIQSYQKLYKSSGSLADAIEQYRSCAQSTGVDEMIFFINLAESCTFDAEIIMQTTTAEHKFMHDLREFYMAFAFAYEQDKEILMNNFAAKYQEISRGLQAMSTRLAQSIEF